ncbi:MAG: hypothetical protein KAS95_02540 [Candidatus Heimdallarchaeota archaeon]|nr:hypothetical protein [Candidatus Heimdallarchaeota archaeon]
MKVKVLRMETIEERYPQALSTLCHQVKNLNNMRNFLVKEQFKKKGKILFYSNLNKLLKQEGCYKILLAHTAQYTLKLLTRN